MKNQFLITLVLALSIASFSQAAMLSNLLAGETLLHDGLTLSDWTYSESGDGTTPDAADVNVNSNGTVLQIQYVGNDFPNAGAASIADEISSDGLLGFKVSGRLVTGVKLNANPNLSGTAGLGSFGEVVESILDSGLDPNANDLQLFVENQPPGVLAPGPDTTIFTSPISSFRVVKDIQLFAVGSGRVTISVIEQEFLPEPSSAGLLSIAGLAGLAIIRRRRR